MKPTRYVLPTCIGLALSLGGAGGLAGQSTGTVRGRVMEAGSERPLAGAQVFIPGTSRGALTNASGEYVLSNVTPGTQRVRAEMLGYTTAEQPASVAAGQAATLDFRLSQSAVNLSELVVTGTPGAVQRKSLGNTVTTVNVAEVTQKVANQSVAELLQSKAPGVTISGGSGEAGTANSIKIRGVTSLTAGNQPAVYVDGVKVFNGSLGNFAPNCCSDQTTSQRTDALGGITPEDIESIEVVKGPAAATLYGADAAAGVIQIITKKGRPGQQKLQWEAKVQAGTSSWGADQPVNYTLCDAAKIAAKNAAGALLWPGCQGVAPGTFISQNVLTYDPREIRDGALRNYALSVRGGGEAYSFYLAGNVDDEDGVFYNNFSNRRSARANFAFNPMPQLDFNVNFGYSQQHIRLPKNDNDANGIMFNSMLFKPGALNPWGNALQPDTANLYDNQTRASSLILGGTANYRPFPWFKNRLTVGYNQTVSQADIFYAPGQMAVRLAADPTGYVAQRIPQQRIYTLDYAGTISTPVTSTINSDFSLGMQFIANRGHYLYADGTGLSSPFTRLVSAAAKTTGSEADSAANSLGFFGQEQVGFSDRLFLTAGVRMDNSSVFGDRINRIFYPKISASYVVSQEPWFHLGHVDNLRLRAAWGQAGKAPGVYAATRTYSASVVTLANHTSAPAVIDSVYGNPDLKPERGEEIEAGFDASLFNNRAGVEFTYYNKHMRNGLLRVDVPPSSGFSGTYLQNLAEIANHGLEISLTGTPIQRRNLSWDARLNLATNSNKLVKFGVVRPPIISATYAPSQRVQEGFPVYGFWRVDPKKDASGNVVLVNGLPQRGDSVYVGPSQPTREAFFSSTLTILRNLTVFGLLDYKGGFYQFNVRDWRRARAFLTKDVLDPGADKTQVALWTSTFITTDWIQPADFIKFRELSLTYSLPTALAQQIHADRASLTLAAHNLGILWTRYGGLDPEANFNGAEDFIRNDAWTVPQQRRLTASLNVSF